MAAFGGIGSRAPLSFRGAGMPDLMPPAAILEAAGSVDRPSEAVLRQCRSELQRAGFQRPVVLAPDGRVISGLAMLEAIRNG